MSIRSFFTGLYNFFIWPFRMIYKCFKRKEQLIVIEKPIVKIEFKTTMEEQFRPMRRKNLVNEYQGKVYFKPLFLTDHFSSKSDSKNDAEFKNIREQARKKAERIKARKELMDKIDKEKEKEKEKVHPEKPRSSSPDSD